MPRSKNKIAIVIQSGCVVQAVSNSDVELLIVDRDTQDEQTPTFKTIGSAGWDMPDVIWDAPLLASWWQTAEKDAQSWNTQ
ncbi:MAG: hypothetical protein C5B50_01025 [Verrucomicrobia bacterium]|nr:MAG: hypothetical protein C5B50_01025 [Verrucomicrobiota bacterium]